MFAKNEANSSAIIQTKGVGTFSSYGVAVPVLEPIVAPEAKTRPLPTTLEQLPQHHADVVATSVASLDAWVVQPILATEQDVEAWYADEYQNTGAVRQHPCRDW